MPRRGHKKSRSGCADCKRRHLKCDETRPSCVNCKVASLKCSYTKSASALLSASRPTSEAPSRSPVTPEASSFAPERSQLILDESMGSDGVNMIHLELLHHYETVTYRSFTTNAELALSFRDAAVSHALKFPFLMYAILALAAMQLCMLRPDQSGYYQALATSLQADGLNRIHQVLSNITSDNCIPVFLFSITTGCHAFCEAFACRRQEFNDFLDKLTNCIKMMRGVRSVLTGGWWAHLRNTSLSSLLGAGNALGEQNVSREAETKPLWDLLRDADIGPDTFETYEETVLILQRVFNAEKTLQNVEASVSMVFAWPVMLGTDYNELLIQRRPEALVILAFYGVILHNRRNAWGVNDSGRVLVHSISTYLGRHWERWLVWPMAVVSSGDASTMLSPPDSTVHATSSTYG